MRISGLISVLLGLACFAAGGTAAVPPAAPEAKDTAPGPSRSDAGKPQSPAKSPARFRWEQVENESLALVGPCGIVWRLNFGPKLTKPYFHPLQTVDGRCLTQVSPKDHPWHYGLWHSWKYLDRVNYWEEDQNGRPEGVARIVARTIRRLDDTGAQIRLVLEYFPYGRPEAVVMADTVDLTIGMPREDGSYRIVWEQVSRARAPVVLDRTPLPGEPEGKSYGGYAGLSFRGDRFLDAVTVRTSTGRTDLDAQRLPAQWAALTGTVDGRPAGIALFDHPSNPRHPTPWYFVLKKSRGGAPHSPFWFVNAAFLNNQPFTLAPGQPLVRRHLVRVDNRPPDAAALEEEFRRFAATSAVPDTHQP